MSEYLGVMERFLDLQESVLKSALAGARPAVEPTAENPWPLAGAHIEANASGGVTLGCRLSVHDEAFLLDHTLGGTVSADPGLRALPVFPLAMSLEMMAQAARLVRPDHHLVEIRDLRVRRWLAFERPAVDIVVTAVPAALEQEIEVRLSVSGPGGAREGPPVVAGIFVLSSEPKPPRSPGPFVLARSRPSRWSPAELYSEGLSHGMFHGPTMRGVASLDRVGDDGIEATLMVADSEGIVRGPGRLQNLVHPLLIDAVSQLVGYWTAETLERDFVVFPVGFERLRLYAPRASGSPPRRARGRARCERLGDQRFRAELAVLGEDGELLAEISGWEVTRAPLPERVYAFRLAPSEVIMSDPLPSAALARRELTGCRLELPETFLAAEEGIWLSSLAFLALGPAERRKWLDLDGSEAERRSWFLRQMAAKDAIRLHVYRQQGVRVYPADIDLLGDGDWPAHAVVQKSGITIAVVGDVGPACGLGIDLHRIDEPLQSSAVTAVESRHFRALPESLQSEWKARVACAERAMVQAVASTGEACDSTVAVIGLDESTESVQLTVAGVRVDVPTVRNDDLVVAIATFAGRQ